MLTCRGGLIRNLCLRQHSIEGPPLKARVKKSRAQRAYLGDGEEVDPALLLLQLAHKHGRSHQQEVRRAVPVHVQRAQGAAEVGADLKHAGKTAG